MQYVICWKQDDKTKRTDYSMPEHIAKAFVETLNRRHPDQFHWMEPA